MRKQFLTLTALGAALTVLGAGCYVKTTVTSGNTSVTVNVPVNAVVNAVSHTTGDFSTGANVNVSTNTSVTLTPKSVSIKNMAYNPSSLTVKKGTKVTWTNDDVIPHTVTGSTGGPSNSDLEPGKSYSFTFDTVGTFNYHCVFHGFTGVVTVTS